MQLHDRFGDAYWLGSATAEPPGSWGDVEVVSPWFARELLGLLDRCGRAQLQHASDPGATFDPEDESAIAAWLDERLQTAAMQLWRRRPTVAPVVGPSRIVELAPQLRDLAPELTWIGWEVVDVEGRPVPGVQYELNTPDGEVRTGTTDANGRVFERGVAVGTCGIRFVSSTAY